MLPKEHNPNPRIQCTLPSVTMEASKGFDCSGDDKLVHKFVNATGVTEVEAERHLRESDWNYDVAISKFSTDMDKLFVEAHEPNDMPSSENEKSGTSDVDMEEDNEKISENFEDTDGPRIVTLASLRRREEKNIQNTEQDGFASYAGGSLNSGQQILEPDRKRMKQNLKTEKEKERDVKDFVQNLFKDAVNNGAEAVSPRHDQDSHHFVTFRHRASNSSVPDESVDTHRPAENIFEPREVYLRTWRNGFTVDDGPLKDYNSAENRKFLKALSQGQIPEEIQERHFDGDGDIYLNFEDFSTKEYELPKSNLLPFSGVGHRLGSPTPKVHVGDLQFDKKWEENAIKALQIDDSEPVTQVQVRLADGSRLLVRLNHTHTIGDIRKYIVIARPEYSASVFSLFSYIPVELDDDGMTIKEADLLNSVVFQRLKEISEEKNEK